MPPFSECGFDPNRQSEIRHYDPGLRAWFTSGEIAIAEEAIGAAGSEGYLRYIMEKIDDLATAENAMLYARKLLREQGNNNPPATVMTAPLQTEARPDNRRVTSERTLVG